MPHTVFWMAFRVHDRHSCQHKIRFTMAAWPGDQFAEVLVAWSCFSKQTGGAWLAVNTYCGYCRGGSEAGRRAPGCWACGGHRRGKASGCHMAQPPESPLGAPSVPVQNHRFRDPDHWSHSGRGSVLIASCVCQSKRVFFFFFSFVLPHTLLHSLPHSHSLCLWLLFYPCLVWVSLGLDESNELLVFEEVLHCVANGYTSQSTGTFWKSLLLLLSNGYHELFSSPWLSTLSGLRKKMSKCMVKQLPSKNGEKCTVGLLLYTTLSKQISKS